MNPRILTLVTGVVALLVVAAIAIVPRLGGGTSGELDLNGQPRLGDADAPVAVALFEDFRCPHCATFTETILPRLERDFVDSGQARIYYLNFPVLGPESIEVAELGECVYAQSETTFWEFKPVLFRSQGGLENRTQLLALAAEYAPTLDQSALATCLDGQDASREVDRDEAMARELRLGGTPSAVVDGRTVTASYEAIAGAIRQALADGN
jgi:protein-disulfide isomerase